MAHQVEMLETVPMWDDNGNEAIVNVSQVEEWKARGYELHPPS